MFDFRISTPAATTKSSPQRTELRLRPGVIDLVEILMPPGPAGLLHLTIERGGSLLWPENEGQGFAWDNDRAAFNPLYDLTQEPTTLYAVTWNEDDTYPHLAVVRFNLVPREVYFPDRRELGILQRMEALMFGRVARRR